MEGRGGEVGRKVCLLVGTRYQPRVTRKQARTRTHYHWHTIVFMTVAMTTSSVITTTTATVMTDRSHDCGPYHHTSKTTFFSHSAALATDPLSPTIPSRIPRTAASTDGSSRDQNKRISHNGRATPLVSNRFSYTHEKEPRTRSLHRTLCTSAPTRPKI